MFKRSSRTALMMTTALFVLLGLGLFAGRMGCANAPTPVENLKLDESAATKTFHLGDHRGVSISLTSNGSVGYGWSFKKLEGDALEPAGTTDDSTGSLAPGSSETTIYHFRAVKPGKSIIVMEYTHRSGAEFSTETRTFTIFVDKAP